MEKENEAVPSGRFGTKAFLGNWMSVESMDFQMNRILFPSSMTGMPFHL